MLITSRSIYILSSALSLLLKVEIKKISDIIVIKNSPALLEVRCKDFTQGLFGESLHRTEIIIFLINSFDLLHLPRPKLIYSNNLKVLNQDSTAKQILNLELDHAHETRAERKFLSNT